MNVKDLAEQMISYAPDYANSVMHKLITWIGVPSSLVYFSQAVEPYVPEFIKSIFAWFMSLDLITISANWFTGIEWMQVFSTYAVILLCAERTFIVWAWWQRKKRGDYNEGNPGRTRKTRRKGGNK